MNAGVGCVDLVMRWFGVVGRRLEEAAGHAQGRLAAGIAATQPRPILTAPLTCLAFSISCSALMGKAAAAAGVFGSVAGLTGGGGAATCDAGSGSSPALVRLRGSIPSPPGSSSRGGRVVQAGGRARAGLP